MKNKQFEELLKSVKEVGELSAEHYFDHLLKEGEQIAQGPIQFWELYWQYSDTPKEIEAAKVHDFMAVMIPETSKSSCYAGDDVPFRHILGNDEKEGTQLAYVIWNTKLKKFIEPHTPIKGESKNEKADLNSFIWYGCQIRDDQHLISLKRVKKLCPQLLQHPWVKAMIKKHGVHELLPYDYVITDDGKVGMKHEIDEYEEEMKNSEKNEKELKDKVCSHEAELIVNFSNAYNTSNPDYKNLTPLKFLQKQILMKNMEQKRVEMEVGRIIL